MIWVWAWDANRFSAKLRLGVGIVYLFFGTGLLKLSIQSSNVSRLGTLKTGIVIVSYFKSGLGVLCSLTTLGLTVIKLIKSFISWWYPLFGSGSSELRNVLSYSYKDYGGVKSPSEWESQQVST